MASLPCASTAGQDRLTDHTGCPPWCRIHSPSDSGFIHYSDVAQVVPTAGGAGEQRPIEVTVEQLQRTPGGARDAAQIVMNHAGFWIDPLTPDEALHLAGLLILAARRAVAG